jgi:dipeptidase
MEILIKYLNLKTISYIIKSLIQFSEDFMKKKLLLIIIISMFYIITNGVLFSCTNYLISKKATVDGSTMITYAADSHTLYGELYYTPGRFHREGEMLDVYEWDTGKYLGKIKQVKKTFTVIGNMNEYQVSIGETTYGGRKELQHSKLGVMDYGSLMYITLQRAKTAREAIKIMGKLVEEYGYLSEGESFSISDPKEVWIMDMIGKGKEKGAVWVARRVPDGYVSAHANQARIRKFPLHDSKNCLYSKDVISFARKMGYFKGKDEDFSFVDAYAPPDFGGLRFCEARVWSFFRRIAPSQNMDRYLDYVKGDPKATPLPLWIKPDKKLSVMNLMDLMRDHFEGTALDMTKDIGAGPYILPYRWRPLVWKLNGKKYFNERAVSTQQTGFSFVAQARGWLPRFIGGVFWFSVDDTYSTVYVPMYCGIKRAPYNYAVGTGDFHHFSWDSAFWVFNFVSNFAYSRYSEMIVDIQRVQRELEGQFLYNQKNIDKAALSLYKKSPELARDYLTKYSSSLSKMVIKRWKKLLTELLVKYLDGNLKDEHGKVLHLGYPKSWYERIVKETGDKFLMRESKKK